MEVLALWEAKFNTPAPTKGRRPGTDTAVQRTRPRQTSWTSPAERARFQNGCAKASYTAVEYVDGQRVEKQMRSTPEGIAWFFGDN